MKRDQKIFLGIVGVGAIILFFLFRNHNSAMQILTPGTTSSQSLPTVAATPAASYIPPETYILPGGSYHSPLIGNDNGCCGCEIPGANNSDNFLPATPTAIYNLIGANTSGNEINSEILNALDMTDYAPQTSDLTNMILSRIGAIGP